METIVYAFFRGRCGSEHERCITSWNVYHWPAEVVRTLVPQAGNADWLLVVPARHLRQRLPSTLEVVEAAVKSEGTETAMDDAEALMWQLRDFVLQAEAQEHQNGQEILIRAFG